MSKRSAADRFCSLLPLLAGLTLFAAAPFVGLAVSLYDGDQVPAVALIPAAADSAPEKVVRERSASIRVATHGYDDRSQVGPGSARPGGYRLAPNTAGGGARFVANRAGDILDTSRIAIPEGKFGYL